MASVRLRSAEELRRLLSTEHKSSKKTQVRAERYAKRRDELPSPATKVIRKSLYRLSHT